MNLPTGQQRPRHRGAAGRVVAVTTGVASSTPEALTGRTRNSYVVPGRSPVAAPELPDTMFPMFVQACAPGTRICICQPAGAMPRGAPLQVRRTLLGVGSEAASVM